MIFVANLDYSRSDGDKQPEGRYIRAAAVRFFGPFENIEDAQEWAELNLSYETLSTWISENTVRYAWKIVSGFEEIEC